MEPVPEGPSLFGELIHNGLIISGPLELLRGVFELAEKTHVDVGLPLVLQLVLSHFPGGCFCFDFLVFRPCEALQGPFSFLLIKIYEQNYLPFCHGVFPQRMPCRETSG